MSPIELSWTAKNWGGLMIVLTLILKNQLLDFYTKANLTCVMKKCLLLHCPRFVRHDVLNAWRGCHKLKILIGFLSQAGRQWTSLCNHNLPHLRVRSTMWHFLTMYDGTFSNYHVTFSYYHLIFSHCLLIFSYYRLIFSDYQAVFSIQQVAFLAVQDSSIGDIVTEWRFDFSNP